MEPLVAESLAAVAAGCGVAGRRSRRASRDRSSRWTRRVDARYLWVAVSVVIGAVVPGPKLLTRAARSAARRSDPPARESLAPMPAAVARWTPRSRSCSICSPRDPPQGCRRWSGCSGRCRSCEVPSARSSSASLDAVDLGARWREELAAVTERLALPDLRRAVAVLTRTETLGTSLTEATRELAADVRRSRRAAVAERARAAPVKMLFPLVFLVLPAFLLLTVVPVLLTTVRVHPLRGGEPMLFLYALFLRTVDTLRLREEEGQTTAEYALVILAAAAVAVVLIAWARSSGKLPAFFDSVIDSVIGDANAA